MKKLAIVLAVGAVALLGGSAANAADRDNTVTANAGSNASQTDFSSHRRKYRHSHRMVNRSYHRQSYGYAPGGYYVQQPQYYAPQPYYGGGPGISFSFGGGGGHRGGGWGHHRGW
jgi:hypothetical protein